MKTIMSMNDKQFFNENPTRQARLRKPCKQPHKDKQRAVRILDEFEMQFRALGPHDPKLRAVLVYRVPADNPNYDPDNPQLIPIPMLEEFEGELQDTDACLLPFLHQLMTQAAG